MSSNCSLYCRRGCELPPTPQPHPGGSVPRIRQCRNWDDFRARSHRATSHVLPALSLFVLRFACAPVPLQVCRVMCTPGAAPAFSFILAARSRGACVCERQRDSLWALVRGERTRDSVIHKGVKQYGTVSVRARKRYSAVPHWYGVRACAHATARAIDWSRGAHVAAGLAR